MSAMVPRVHERHGAQGAHAPGSTNAQTPWCLGYMNAMEPRCTGGMVPTAHELNGMQGA